MPERTANYLIEFNVEDIPPDALPALLALVDDLNPILLDIAATFWQQVEEEIWDTEGGSVGKQWPALDPGYLARKVKEGYPAQILVRTGWLSSNIAQAIVLTKNSVTVGFNRYEVPYGIYHDDPQGGSKLPQRILIEALPSKIKELADLFAQFISDQTGLDRSDIQIVTT